MAHDIRSPDEPSTPQEITRRKFLANATVVIGGIVGLGVGVPVIATTIPTKELMAGKKTWYPLNEDEFKKLQTSTDTPTKIFFHHKITDGYIVTDTPEFVWGIKMTPAAEAKMRAERPDLFQFDRGRVDFSVFNLGFVMLSPICPHLGCHFDWKPQVDRFVCPCHGSTFTRYGKHLSGPAPRGLDPLPFRERTGIAEITWVDFRSIVPARIIISYS